MKRKVIITLAGAVALLMGYLFGFHQASRKSDALLMDHAYSEASIHAHIYMRGLTELREGKQNDAIELLESRLDGELLTYIGFESLRPEDRSASSLLAIRRAREYRAKYPWHNSSDEIGGGVERVFKLTK